MGYNNQYEACYNVYISIKMRLADIYGKPHFVLYGIVIFSVFIGRDPHYFLENISEIITVLIAAEGGDFSNRHLRFHKQIGSHLYADVVEILVKAKACDALEFL